MLKDFVFAQGLGKNIKIKLINEDTCAGNRSNTHKWLPSEQLFKEQHLLNNSLKN